jgi:hypothetical protein
LLLLLGKRSSRAKKCGPDFYYWWRDNLDYPGSQGEQYYIKVCRKKRKDWNSQINPLLLPSATGPKAAILGILASAHLFTDDSKRA